MKIRGNIQELKEFLDEKAWTYNRTSFIEEDPIQVPHLFSDPENIAVSGFLTASIAWGQRRTIIQNARRLMAVMEHDPVGFLQHATEKDFRAFSEFRHRTFNGEDCIYFMRSLADIYRESSLGSFFRETYKDTRSMEQCLVLFRNYFLRRPPGRTAKHVPDVSRNSAAKRLNMFLRWMVRKDERGVDFGIWAGIPMSELFIPLDVHTGRAARKLGLLQRNCDDWKAVKELTGVLKILDPGDPVRYDFALFGMGKYEDL